MRQSLARAGLDASYANLLVRREDDGEDDVDDAAAAIVAAVGGADQPAVAAPRNRGNRPPSFVRRFFVEEHPGEGDEQKILNRCKLMPETGQSHPVTIGDELKSLKRHITKSQFHKKAYEYYTQLVNGGMEEGAAVDAVILRHGVAAHGGSSSGPMDAFVKRATHSATATSQTVVRELTFLCYAITTGASFRSADNAFLTHYHALSNNAAPPPGRERISDVLLPLLYNIVLEHRKLLLHKVDFFAVSADAWTNEQGEQFVGVNASFVDHSFQMRSFLLDMVALPERHTWCHIAHKVAVVLETNMPPEALLTTTVTDNASVMLKAALALHTNLDEMAIDNMGDVSQWLEPNGRHPNDDDDADGEDDDDDADDDDGRIDPTALWACIDHKAQLAALDVLGVDGNAPAAIRSLYTRLRALVRHIRQSPKLTHLLREYCTELNVAFVKPILDVKTRWLSMWMMGETAHKLHRPILRMAAQGAFDDERQYGDLNILLPCEWAQVDVYTKLLEPVADFVRVCEGEQYITMAAAPVLFLRARQAMHDAAGEDQQLKNLKMRLRNAWDRRLGFLVARPNLALAAAAMHPAYGHLRFISDQVREKLARRIAKWAFEFAQVAPAVAHVDRANRSTGARIVVSRSSLSISRFRDLYNDLYQSHVNDLPPAVAGGDVLALETPQHDALAFWLANSTGDLRALAQFARIVFGVPATSASTERTFSRAGRLSHDRNRLADYKLSMMTVIATHLSEHARSFPKEAGRSTAAHALAAAEDFISHCLQAIDGPPRN